MSVDKKKSRNEAISGFLAGASSTLILHPLDLIKTRIQVDRNSRSEALFGRIKRAVFHIVYPYGRGAGQSMIVKNLWTGVSPNFAGATTAWALYFYFYSHSKSIFADLLAKGDYQAYPPAYVHLAASASAGCVTCIFTNPLWVVKTRMCTQDMRNKSKYRGLFDGLYRIARSEGLAGLYSGFVPALLGVSHGAVQFMVYEELKRRNPSRDSSGNYAILAAASKVLASILTYPYQVIKSRLQSQDATCKVYQGTWDAVKQTWRQESLLGFYRGIGANLLRVLPGTCITFAVYEYMSSYLHQKEI